MFSMWEKVSGAIMGKRKVKVKGVGEYDKSETIIGRPEAAGAQGENPSGQSLLRGGIA